MSVTTDSTDVIEDEQQVEPPRDWSKDYVRVMVASKTWAMRRDLVERLADVVPSYATIDQVEALQPRGQGYTTPPGGVAVVDLMGMIMPEASGLFALLFGAAGLNTFQTELRHAIADPDVKAVVMNVDSPGGLVDHVPETAAMIRQAREAKPIVAVANTQAASAAYWLASQAHEVVVTPSGEVGSVGVYQRHMDMSGALEQAGIKPTLISAGKYKVEGNPYEPLGDEAKAAAQQAVDDFYGMFVKDIAAGRGIEPEEVDENYGQGRQLLAKRAVKAGLADRVATLGQTVQRLQSGRAVVKRIQGAPSALEWPDDVDDIDRSASEGVSSDAGAPVAAAELTAEDKKRLGRVAVG